MLDGILKILNFVFSFLLENMAQDFTSAVIYV